MSVVLVVQVAFGPFSVNDKISDDAHVYAILSSPDANKVAIQGQSTPSGPVTPSQPNALAHVAGSPSTSLAYTYGYAVDDVGHVLYQWSGTAWTAILVAAGGGGPALGTLTLSTLTGVADTAFSATIAGQANGSTLAATSSDGTALAISNGTLSVTFATAGQKQVSIVETLAGATGSPKTTTLTLTIASAVPVLGTLSLSTLSAVTGQGFTATISGQTNGSAITATSSDGTALAVSGGTVSGTFSVAGSPVVTLTETLAGATGSPKSTTLTLSVTAVPVDRTATTDLSNPDRGLNPLI